MTRSDGGPGLGQEHPEYCLLERGATLEIGDLVVREGPGQSLAEPVGQVLPVDVQTVQVGVEVLARAVYPLVGLLPRQLAGYGSSSARSANTLNTSISRRSWKLAGRDQLGACNLIMGDGARGVLWCEVEPQQEAAQVVKAPRDAGGRSRLRECGQVQALDGAASSVAPASTADRPLRWLETDNRRAGLDLTAGAHQQFAHPGGIRGTQAPSPSSSTLKHQHRRARLDAITDGHRRGHHERRRR